VIITFVEKEELVIKEETEEGEESEQTDEETESTSSSSDSKKKPTRPSSNTGVSSFGGVQVEEVYVPPPPPVFNVATQVDSFGNLTVKFNQPLKVPDWMKTKLGKVTRRQLQENSLQTLTDIVSIAFKPSSENSGDATVDIIGLDEKGISYKINFTKPSEISVGMDQDEFEVKVN